MIGRTQHKSLIGTGYGWQGIKTVFTDVCGLLKGSRGAIKNPLIKLDWIAEMFQAPVHQGTISSVSFFFFFHRPTHRFRRLFLDLFLIGWAGCASAMGVTPILNVVVQNSLYN